MKKLIFLLLLIAGFNVIAQAQFTRKTPQQRAAHFTKTLQKTLNLSSGQASKVNAILLARAIEMDNLKNSPSGSKKSDQLAKKSFKLSTDKQLMAILNSSQQKQYLQWEKIKEEKHREKKGATAPPAEG